MSTAQTSVGVCRVAGDADLDGAVDNLDIVALLTGSVHCGPTC